MEEDPELVALREELNRLRLRNNKLLQTHGNDRQWLRKKANSRSAQNELARLRIEHETLQAHCAEQKAMAKWEKNELEKKREILRNAQQQEQLQKEFHRSVVAEVATIKGSTRALTKAKAEYNRTLNALKKAKEESGKLEEYARQLLCEQAKLLELQENQDAIRLNFMKDSDKDFAEVAKKENDILNKSEVVDEKYAKLQLELTALEAEKMVLMGDLQKESGVVDSLNSQIADAKKKKEDVRLNLKATCDHNKALKQQLQDIQNAKDEEAFYRKESQQLSNEVIKCRNSISTKKQQWRKAEARLQVAESVLEKLENNDTVDFSTSFLDASIVMGPPRTSFMKQTPTTNAPPNTFAPIPRRRTPSKPRNSTSQKPFTRSGSLSRLN